MYNLAQKLLAEFLGTFGIVLTTIGAICADQYATATGKPGFGMVGVALAYGMSVAAMMAAMGHVSGGHFNPAVTIGLWVTRRLGSVNTVCYWASQLLGAIAAAYLLKFILPEPVWGPAALGMPQLAPDFTRTHAMALEAIATFLLVWVFFAAIVDANGSLSKVAGFAVGLTVTVGILFAGPFTGGALNPARAFGPALAASHWANHGVYWVGPLFGGLFAGFLYDRIFLGKQSPAEA